jgi:putative transposase of IS4/5 family DUF4096
MIEIMRITNEQWNILAPMLKKLPRLDGRGRPRRDDREVLEGILWVLKTGANGQQGKILTYISRYILALVMASPTKEASVLETTTSFNVPALNRNSTTTILSRPTQIVATNFYTLPSSVHAEINREIIYNNLYGK